MPASELKSKAQVRAMYAAAAGKSTIGIPQSVGKEFAVGKPRKGLPQHVKKAKGKPSPFGRAK
jgi:hypothetical protein